MKVGLIITTYNWPEALRLVLETIKLQNRMPDEVVIADDGSELPTKTLISQYQKDFPCPVKHAWQEDKGFRAAASRNNALRSLSSDIDYVVMIDGDMLLHHDFIQDHLKFARQGCFIQGSRALISRKKTAQLFNGSLQSLKMHFFSPGIQKRKNTLRIKMLAKLLSKPAQKLKGIRSCNMSFWFDDLKIINGFNEDFVGWGKEVSELVVRLFNSGIERLDLKFSALAYHLFHNEHSRDSLPENKARLEDAMTKKIKRCDRGLIF